MTVLELAEKVQELTIQVQLIKQDLETSISELSKGILKDKLGNMESRLEKLNGSIVTVEGGKENGL